MIILLHSFPLFSSKSKSLCTRQQGKRPSRRASMRIWSRVRKATNHEACRMKMAAMAMALLMQNTFRPGRICEDKIVETSLGYVRVTDE